MFRRKRIATSKFLVIFVLTIVRLSFYSTVHCVLLQFRAAVMHRETIFLLPTLFTQILVLPPNHLVHNPRIGLDDLDDFGGDVFVDVVRDGRAVVAGGVHRHGGVHGLQQAAGVDAGDEKARLVERLGALGRRADAYRRERMAYRGEEG